MKLKLLQEDLNKNLSITSRFVASRPQLPILANILFSAEKNNKLFLTATNLEIGICCGLGAKVETTGKLAIPAKEISEFVSYLSVGKLTLESKKKTQIKIISPSGESLFTGMDPAEFPKIPSINEDEAVSLPMKGMIEAVNQVGFAVAGDDTRPVLGAINWQFTTSGYRMVATDGYRLSLKNVSGVKIKVNAKNGKTTFLIPARSLAEIVRLAAGQDKIKVGLTKDGNQVIFLLPDLQLTSRLIEGEFPDYEKIIPSQTKTKVVLEKEEFLQAVKIASVFARESANVVKFSLKDNRMTISANAPSVGENKTEVGAKIDGPKLEIAFNFRFILDFLNAVPVEEGEINLEFTESLTPGLFKIPSDSSWLHLIMPVRVDL